MATDHPWHKSNFKGSCLTSKGVASVFHKRASNSPRVGQSHTSCRSQHVMKNSAELCDVILRYSTWRILARAQEKVRDSSRSRLVNILSNSIIISIHIISIITEMYLNTEYMLVSFWVKCWIHFLTGSKINRSRFVMQLLVRVVF